MTVSSVIDFHAHFFGDATSADVIALEAARLGVDCLCVSNVSSYIPAPDEVERLNAVVYEGCARHPGVLLPFAYVNPLHGDRALSMLNDGLRHGVCGIKLWVSVWADDPCVEPVARWAIDHDLPIMHHSWMKWNGNIPSESQAHQVARLGRKFPDLRLVMAHVGGDWEFGVKAVRDVENVSVDTSGSYGDSGMIEMCVAELGEDRVLFGSDVPGVDLAFTLAKITGADISPEAKEKILGLNALRVLGAPCSTMSPRRVAPEAGR